MMICGGKSVALQSSMLSGGGHLYADELRKLSAEARQLKLRPSTLCFLAFTLDWAGEFDEAVALLRWVRSRHPTDFWTHLHLGTFLLLKKGATPIQLEEATGCFFAALALRPDRSIAYNFLGEALKAQGQMGEAMHAYGNAITFDPNFAAAHYNLGVAWIDKKQPEKGIAEIREAIRLSPIFAQVANNMAWLLATAPDPNQRDGRQSVAVARLAVEAAPTNGKFWNTLGAAQYRAGNFKEAVAALGKSMELRKDGESFDWFFLAMGHWQLGEKEKARKCFDQAVQWMEKNQPKDEELRRFRAEAEELLKKEPGVRNEQSDKKQKGP
jgi:Flp pilus assembly protein TadD